MVRAHVLSVPHGQPLGDASNCVAGVFAALADAVTACIGDLAGTARRVRPSRFDREGHAP